MNRKVHISMTLVFLSITGCSGDPFSTTSTNNLPEITPAMQLPINTRNFYIGFFPTPREVIYSFAVEPSLNTDGNTLYFVHHFYSKDLDTMLEADIYVSNGWSPDTPVAGLSLDSR